MPTDTNSVQSSECNWQRETTCESISVVGDVSVIAAPVADIVTRESKISGGGNAPLPPPSTAMRISRRSL
jgi:hypothetical protein